MAVFFFKENGLAVTITKEWYIKMIQNIVIPELKKKRKFSTTWFQQDGAMPHTARVMLNVLRSAFKNRLISRGANIEVQWPPRSADLSLCHCFLWGYLKSKVYFSEPCTLQALKKIFATKQKKLIVNVSTTVQKHQKKNFISVSDVTAIICLMFYLCT